MGHAADTASFIAQCYANGIVFDRRDMDIAIRQCKKLGNNPGWVYLANYDTTPGTGNLRYIYSHHPTKNRENIENIEAYFAAVDANAF